MTTFNALLFAAFAALVIAAPAANAAHNSNNLAEVVGTAADPDATGKAIVNYSEGGGDFTGTITVANLVPGATYSYSVWRTAVDGSTALLCTGEANSQGMFTCQAQHFMLGGFRHAVVRDAAGVVVAMATFACRDPDQSTTQCDAPGRVDP